MNLSLLPTQDIVRRRQAPWWGTRQVSACPPRVCGAIFGNYVVSLSGTGGAGFGSRFKASGLLPSSHRGADGRRIYLSKAF
jgi:hypothetical protein